ncbi:MAG: acetate/propionate family kinase, partial [Bacilli bacterium]|nr:acetate/propionate family kinase [Bacilli bacterium]
MKVLSVNAGSSSLKFQMYEMPEEKALISGVFERIGIDNSFYTIKINGEKTKKEIDLKNHKQAFEILVEELIENKVVDSLDEIKGIGHRVVQGGAYFDKTVVVDEEVIDKIAELSTLAPLHNPAAITGIKAAQEVVPNAVQTVVFDTAFHQTMDEVNYLYAVPYSWYEDYKIRRYGAHGTSHKYVALRMNEILGRFNTKLITCHIGNGASISAVLNGECINTSMGLTPNAGLIMGSRCGDIDATIVPYIMEKTGMTPKEVDTALNKQSGLLGISGVSSDSRDIEDGIN